MKAGDKNGAKNSLAKRKLLIEQSEKLETDIMNLEKQKWEFYDIQDLDDLRTLEGRVKSLNEEAKVKLSNGDKNGTTRILSEKKILVQKIQKYKNKLEGQKKEGNNIQDMKSGKEELNNFDFKKGF